MKAYVDALIARRDWRNLPYFAALRDGSFTRADFVETQIQFLFAVVFFSRPMTVLAARLPRPEMRLALFDNALDEHGKGDMRFSHERTFLTLLERLGVTTNEIDTRALWPEVRMFNSALAGCCLLDDVAVGLAALGMIEQLFAGISAELGRGIIGRGWLTHESIIHYATHEELDEEHAEGFFSLLGAPYADDARQRYAIEQGLELGATCLLGLYNGLYTARERRATREIRGPHSAADGWWLG